MESDLLLSLLFWALLLGVSVAKKNFRLVLIGFAIGLVGGAIAGVVEATEPEPIDGVVSDSDWVMRVATLLSFGIMLAGVLRLAKPDSWYARRFYGEEKMLRAEARYAPENAERVQAAEALQERATSSHFGFECRQCGEAFESQVDAEHHVGVVHPGSDPASAVARLGGE